jgi:hypothetical protein
MPMAPDTERELLEKVNEIHGYIFGVQGRPGAMESVDAQLKEHDERIVSLEKWRWYLAGAGFVAIAVVKIVWGH